MSDGQILTADEVDRLGVTKIYPWLPALLDSHEALRAERDWYKAIFDTESMTMDELREQLEDGERIVPPYDQVVAERDQAQRTVDDQSVAINLLHAAAADAARERDQAIRERDEAKDEARLLIRAAEARERTLREAARDVIGAHGNPELLLAAVLRLDAALAGTSPPADEQRVGWWLLPEGVFIPNGIGNDEAAERFPDSRQPVYVRRPAEPVVVDPPTVTCEPCRGTGHIPHPKPPKFIHCEACEGRGLWAFGCQDNRPGGRDR